MPRKKEVPIRYLVDGWRGLHVETIEDFKRDDPEGYHRIEALSTRLYPRTKDAIFRNLCLVSFQPASVAYAMPTLQAALANEFAATVNLLTYCHMRFLKLMSTEQGLAELHLTGASLLKNLMEAGKEDLTYKRIPDLLPITRTGIKNALPAIMRRRKDKKRG